MLFNTAGQYFSWWKVGGKGERNLGAGQRCLERKRPVLQAQCGSKCGEDPQVSGVGFV